MLYMSEEVALPAEHISIQGGYVYKVIKSWRDDEGQHHQKKCIGKLKVDAEGVRCLIPNDSYYKENKLDPPTNAMVKGSGKPRRESTEEVYCEYPDGSRVGFGLGIACFSTAASSGLYECLERVFGTDTATAMISLGTFYLSGPRGLTALEYFTATQMCFTNHVLTSQDASRVFGDITAKDRDDFFKLWIAKAEKHRNGDEYVCYDVTSISSYSDSLAEISFGYNRDHEQLRQVNVGMFTTCKDGIPLGYTDYNGSINDFTNFPYVLDWANSVGLSGRFILVMDGIFSEKETVDFSVYSGYDLIVGTPIEHCPGVKRQLLEWRRSGTATPFFSGYESVIESDETSFDINSTAGRLMMYRADVTAMGDRAGLVSTTNNIKKALDGRDKSRNPPTDKKTTAYFDISVNDDGSWDYVPNDARLQDALKLCGCFALFVTSPTVNCEEALRLYRSKDVVEKAFGELKNDILGERMLCHSEETWKGKMFVMFVALVLRRFLMKKLRTWIKEHRSSLEAVLIMLRDIQCRKAGSRWVLAKAFTKEQKELISVLGLNVDFLDQGPARPGPGGSTARSGKAGGGGTGKKSVQKSSQP